MMMMRQWGAVVGPVQCACSIVKCQVQRRSFQRSAVEHFCEVEFKFKVLAEQLSTELSIWALLGSLCSAV